MNTWFSDSLISIRKYSSKSIFYKYMKMLAGILLVPFIILNIIIFNLYSSTAEKEIQGSLNESFIKSANIFESAFTSAENNYLLCSNDMYIQSYMLMSTPDFTASNRNTINHIKTIMSYMKSSSPYLDSIYLYSCVSDYVISTKNSAYLSYFSDTAWYEYYKNINGCQRFVLQTKNNNTNILSFGYEVYSSRELVGVVVLNIDIDILSELTMKNNKENMFIFDKSGNIVFASNENPPTFDFSLKDEIQEDKIHFIQKKNTYTFAKKFEALEYLIVSEYDMSFLHTTGTRAHLVLFLLIALSVILAFLIAIYMSFQFYNSISTIMASFSELGVPVPTKKPDNYDEIKFITENILQNSTSKARAEQELTQKMMYLQKAQTIALQTQFTPHFLFNTLNHISVTLMNTLGFDNPASRMITILADLLTIALDTKEYTTDIKTEIFYAKKYIELEGIKHDNNFDVTWNIDESLYEYTTPKLILQPILENSFKHGINPLRHKRRGKIDISVKRADDNIIFCIKDNGIGISEERLIEINERLAQNDIPETRHIGLCNVHQRIQLLFKEDYGCTILNTPPGVTVNICIPCKNIPPSKTI